MAGMTMEDEQAPGLLSLRHPVVCDAIRTRRPQEARTRDADHIDYVHSHLEPSDVPRDGLEQRRGMLGPPN